MEGKDKKTINLNNLHAQFHRLHKLYTKPTCVILQNTSHDPLPQIILKFIWENVRRTQHFFNDVRTCRKKAVSICVPAIMGLSSPVLSGVVVSSHL